MRLAAVTLHGAASSQCTAASRAVATDADAQMKAPCAIVADHHRRARSTMCKVRSVLVRQVMPYTQIEWPRRPLRTASPMRGEVLGVASVGAFEIGWRIEMLARTVDELDGSVIARRLDRRQQPCAANRGRCDAASGGARQHAAERHRHDTLRARGGEEVQRHHLGIAVPVSELRSVHSAKDQARGQPNRMHGMLKAQLEEVRFSVSDHATRPVWRLAIRLMHCRQAAIPACWRRDRRRTWRRCASLPQWTAPAAIVGVRQRSAQRPHQRHAADMDPPTAVSDAMPPPAQPGRSKLSMPSPTACGQDTRTTMTPPLPGAICTASVASGGRRIARPALRSHARRGGGDDGASASEATPRTVAPARSTTSVRQREPLSATGSRKVPVTPPASSARVIDAGPSSKGIADRPGLATRDQGFQTRPRQRDDHPLRLVVGVEVVVTAEQQVDWAAILRRALRLGERHDEQERQGRRRHRGTSPCSRATHDGSDGETEREPGRRRSQPVENQHARRKWRERRGQHERGGRGSEQHDPGGARWRGGVCLRPGPALRQAGMPSWWAARLATSRRRSPTPMRSPTQRLPTSASDGSPPPVGGGALSATASRRGSRC